MTIHYALILPHESGFDFPSVHTWGGTLRVPESDPVEAHENGLRILAGRWPVEPEMVVIGSRNDQALPEAGRNDTKNHD